MLRMMQLSLLSAKILNAISKLISKNKTSKTTIKSSQFSKNSRKSTTKNKRRMMRTRTMITHWKILKTWVMLSIFKSEMGEARKISFSANKKGPQQTLVNHQCLASKSRNADLRTLDKQMGRHPSVSVWQDPQG